MAAGEHGRGREIAEETALEAVRLAGRGVRGVRAVAREVRAMTSETLESVPRKGKARVTSGERLDAAEDFTWDQDKQDRVLGAAADLKENLRRHVLRAEWLAARVRTVAHNASRAVRLMVVRRGPGRAYVRAVVGAMRGSDKGFFRVSSPEKGFFRSASPEKQPQRFTVRVKKKTKGRANAKQPKGRARRRAKRASKDATRPAPAPQRVVNQSGVVNPWLKTAPVPTHLSSVEKGIGFPLKLMPELPTGTKVVERAAATRKAAPDRSAAAAKQPTAAAKPKTRRHFKGKSHYRFTGGKPGDQFTWNPPPGRETAPAVRDSGQAESAGRTQRAKHASRGTAPNPWTGTARVTAASSAPPAIGPAPSARGELLSGGHQSGPKPGRAAAPSPAPAPAKPAAPQVRHSTKGAHQRGSGARRVKSKRMR